MAGTSAGAKKAAATRKNKSTSQGNKPGQKQQLTDEERNRGGRF